MEKLSIKKYYHQFEFVDNLVYDVFKTISLEPTKEARRFVFDVINGGKTDNTEKASTICGYFDKQEKEQAVFELLSKSNRNE